MPETQPTRTPEQIDLLRRTLRQIETHPETWNQGTWRCQSGMCFAGWTATLAGREWAYPDSSPDSSMLLAEEEDPQAFVMRWDDEPEVIYVATAAKALLGLDETEADLLFYGGNTLRTIKAYVANLIAGRDIEADEGFEETRS
jgi:hypothetical protein